MGQVTLGGLRRRETGCTVHAIVAVCQCATRGSTSSGGRAARHVSEAERTAMERPKLVALLSLSAV